MKKIFLGFVIIALIGTGCVSSRSLEDNLDEKFLTVIHQLPPTGCSILDPQVRMISWGESTGMNYVELVNNNYFDNTEQISTNYCLIIYFIEEGSEGIFVAYDISVKSNGNVLGTVEMVRLNKNGTISDNLFDELTKNVDFSEMPENEFGTLIAFPIKKGNGILYQSLETNSSLEILWNGEEFENTK